MVNTPGMVGSPRVLGLGSCGVDLLAYVAKYPEPDAKIRTTDFKVQGGGNAGNTLTGLSRLGVSVDLMTKVGKDQYGRMIMDELEQDGVGTGPVVAKAGLTSPFTYVVVDTQTLTRTCIHTPCEEDVLESEVHEGLLTGVNLVHLDSRHTQAAVKLATLARKLGVPLVLDAEKDRPHFRDLFPLCDYIVTNSVFPVQFTGSTSLEEGMAALLRLGHASFVVTTLGADGSIMMCKPGSAFHVDRLIEPTGGSALPLATTSGQYQCPNTKEKFPWLRCAAWPIKPSDIVDTTGAGDAFIAGVIYGLLHHYSAPRLLNLASFVASHKLKAPGARAGLPHRHQVDPQLVTSES